MVIQLKSVTAVILSYLIVTISAISYNVISEPLTNMAVAVIVDKVVFPLNVSSGILYQGEAPSAIVGYQYAYVDATNFTVQKIESFLRAPLKKGSTLNEFFNRSLSTYDVVSLPQALEPLQSIHRIHSDLHIENQIPTIHLYGNTSATDYLHANQQKDTTVRLYMTYFGLNNIQTFENVKVSLSGRSSRWVPKLSYGLKLNKKNKSTLFGYKNFKLRALAHDFSYVRENLCHHVLRACGVPVSGISYVRLFIDNKAVGLFGLVETFQDPWLASEFANGDKGYKSGNLYQSVGFAGPFGKDFYLADLRYEGDNSTQYSLGQYKIKAGPAKKSVDKFKELREFISFIHDSSVERTPETEWERRLNVHGFIRAMAVEDLLGLTDGYMTMGNNFYLYKNPQQTGRITYIPADFDTSIGKSFFNMSMMTSGNYSEHPGIFFRPLTKHLLSYPTYAKHYQDLLLKITTTLVNPFVLDPYIDSIVNMIRTDVEWDTTLPRLGKTVQPDLPKENMTEIAEILFRNFPDSFYFWSCRCHVKVLPVEDIIDLSMLNYCISIKK